MRPESAWQAFFDGHAPHYLDNCFTKNTLAEVDFLIDELGISPGALVLDVGCGVGRHDIELARRGYRVTGIDLSEGMLEQARQGARAAGVELTLRQADAASFTVDRPFDAAICLCEGAFGLLGAGDDPIEQPSAILRSIAAALEPDSKCLFTVLNGYAMVRRHTNDDVAQGAFDPLGLTERSDCIPAADASALSLRERGFVPTELDLLFPSAGLRILHMWGGTAGNWGRRPIDLDEMEIMVVAQKPA